MRWFLSLFPFRLRLWLAERLMMAIRVYFTGREVHWMTRLNGQSLHRGIGRVVSARIDRGEDRFPTGMTFFWSMPGRPIGEMERFQLVSIERDKTMGWCFYQ